MTSVLPLRLSLVNSDPTPDIVVDMSTGNGVGVGGGSSLFTPAAMNGSTDDMAAFLSFRDWAVNTWQAAHTGLIQLYIPPGSAATFKANQQRLWASGIKKLRVIGYGATLTTPDGFVPFALGGLGMNPSIGLTSATGISARIQTVSSGASSVILTTSSFNAGYLDRFTVGRWVLVTGFDLQSTLTPSGYPPNMHYFEYLKIASINAGTGEITFYSALANSYKSTWPSYNTGNGSEIDPGGPGTIYALDPSWDTEVDYRGLTIDQPGDTGANGRLVTYRGVTFLGVDCGIPSQNLIYRAVGCNFPTAIMEVDKMCQTAIIDQSYVHQFLFQSSSVGHFIMSNSTTEFLQGTPRRATISDSTLTQFTPGPMAYGRTEEITLTNVHVPAGGVVDGGYYDIIPSASTMTAGVIKITKSVGSVTWATPGAILFFRGIFNVMPGFTVTDVTEDSTFVYVHTNLAGGFPALDYGSYATSKNVRTHPCPKFTCTGCTGDNLLLDMNNAPAETPLYSWSTRVYDGTDGAPIGPTIWGWIKTLDIDVTTAYTGARSNAAFTPFATKSAVAQDYSSTTYGPIVRITNPGGTPHNLDAECSSLVSCTVTGNQTGDSGYALSESVWMAGGGGSTPTYDDEATCIDCRNNPSFRPSITVTIRTDLGLP